MIRNENGINFDVGYPLTEDDFHILYVEINKDKHRMFIDWIQDPCASPLIICGQIGTGKTTFIEKCIFENTEKEMLFDIKLSFDTDMLFHFEGEYWGRFLGEIIGLTEKLNMDISSFGLANDLLGQEYSEVDLKKRLTNEASSISEIRKQKDLYIKLENFIEELIPVIKKIISWIETKNNRKLFIYAEGIDKFKYNEAAYLIVQDLLDFMADYKTLYEVNFVHYFFGNDKWRKSDSIILYNADIPAVEAVLEKRLGERYQGVYSGIIPAAARLSGGNLRQGLKILSEYYYALNALEYPADRAFSHACRFTRNNTLFLTRERFPSDLIQVVYRDRYLLTDVIRGPQRDDVHDALYNNWIMIINESEAKKQWKSAINPLIVPANDFVVDLPESPEVILLKKWAKAHEASPFGLEFYQTSGVENSRDVTATIEPENKLAVGETLAMSRIYDMIDSEDIGLNPFHVIELFERLATFFLEEKRKDKIIIAYDDSSIAEIANDYIIGKASTFKPVSCKDIFLENPTAEKVLTEITSVAGRYDIISVFFGNALSEKDALTLNKLRDKLIQNRMLWWIKLDHLKSYLGHWIQLKQFFLTYRLDENLQEWITNDEILEALEEFSDSDPDETKKRLKKVLRYLESKKNG